MLGWQYWVVDHATGTKQVLFNPKAVSVTCRLNAVGGGTVTVNVRDEIDWEGRVRQWETLLVGEYDGIVRWAGYVATDEFDDDAGLITYTIVDLWAIFEYRYSFGVGGGGTSALPGYENGTLAFTSKSWVSAVRAVLIDQTRNGTVGRWNLPLVLPPDGAGGVSRTFENYAFMPIAEMLEDLMNSKGGPDVEIRPRWSSTGKLEWVVRVAAPRFSDKGIDLVRNATLSQIRGLKRKRDGTKVLTGVFAIGKGSEKNMRIGRAGGGSTRMTVFRDTANAYKEIDDVARLNAQAESDVEAFGQPTTQWSFSYMGDLDPTMGPTVNSTTLGHNMRLLIRNHYHLPDGIYPQYVIELSYDMTLQVSLAVQQIGVG